MVARLVAGHRGVMVVARVLSVSKERKKDRKRSEMFGYLCLCWKNKQTESSTLTE